MKTIRKSYEQWEPQHGSKAVIYCRVSSVKQARDGHGLSSQETRCREFATHKQYEVVQVFHDEAVTGSLLDRPKIKELLAFLNQQKRHQRHVVIIDDISRLARDIETHIKLRAAIHSAGGKLESPSIEFGEDSDSRLVEHLLASVAAHQREKNTEQVMNRMRARMMNGYWVFKAPIGYRYERRHEHGKILVRDEPIASVIIQALEGYARGRFESQSEVKRFLESQALYPKDRNGEVHYERLHELFSRVLYAGYIDFPSWGLTLHPAKHEPLISFETYQAIQDRLRGQAKAPARKDLHDDFPLRGFITCACCGQPLSACWSKGRNEKYPYYFCYTKSCEDHRKSIKKEVLEGEFEGLLKQLRPSPSLFILAREMFKDLWDQRQSLAQQEIHTMKAQIPQIERQVEKIVSRLLETENSTAVKHYEKEIERLDEQKLLLQEKIDRCGRPLEPFEDCFRTAMTFLANPCYLWSSDRLEDKRMVLRLVFADKLAYMRDKGFRTAEIALPFRLLRDFNGQESGLVEGTGVEPATPTLRT